MLLLGIGAALLTCRDNLRRRSGAVLSVLALALGGFGVNGQRLFLPSRDPRITWTPGQANVVGRVDLNGSAYRLHLSPGGQRFATQGAGRPAHYVDNEDEVPARLWKFTIASTAGARRTTEAFDLAFVDDERVLVLRPARASDDSLDIAVERADGADGASSWRRTIAAHHAPILVLDRETSTWRVTGHDVRAGTIASSVGRIGSDSVKTTRHSATLWGGHPLHRYRDGTSLTARPHESFGIRQMLLAMLGSFPSWDVWHVVSGERRSVGTLPGLPECGGRDEMLLCVVRGRSGANVWRVGVGGSGTPASPTSLGVLPAGLDVWDIGVDGRIAATSRDGGTLAIVDAGLGRGTRIALGGSVRLQGTPSGPPSYVTDVAVGPGIVAILVVRDGKSDVTLYHTK